MTRHKQIQAGIVQVALGNKDSVVGALREIVTETIWNSFDTFDQVTLTFDPVTPKGYRWTEQPTCANHSSPKGGIKTIEAWIAESLGNEGQWR